LNIKEKRWLIIADVLILFLAIYPIFLGGIVGGYDPGFHMGRIQTLANNIAGCHFPNPIGFEYLNKFGYGIGFFYGNLFIYPFALLRMLGVSLYHTYAVYIITFVILNIISINYVVQKLFNNRWATILSAPIYLSSYYTFGVIYSRAAAGELIAFAIIPWILLSLFKIVQGEYKYWYMLGIALSLLLATHVLSFLIAVGTAVFIFIMNLIPIFKDKKIFFSFTKGALLFLGLSSVFLFSFVQQYLVQKYVDTSTNSAGRYLLFVNADWLNQTFDMKQFVSTNGTFLVLLLLFSFIYYLYKGRGFHFSTKIIPQAFIIILVYGMLMLSPDFLHLVVKLFKPIILLQVVTRVNVVLLPLLTFVVANALGNIISDTGKFKIPMVTGFLAILTVITVMFPIQNNLNFVANRKSPISTLSVSMGEYEPREFFNYNTANDFKINDNFLEKSEKINIVKNNRNKVVVKVEDNNRARTVMLPRLYYKGYQVKLTYDGKTKTSPASTKNGLVAANLPRNFKSGKIEVTYKMTSIAKTGWVVFILTFCYLVWAFLKKFRRQLM